MEESSIVRSINSAIKKGQSKLCCGGSLPIPPHGVRIWYSKDDGTQELLLLPVEPYDDASIEALVAVTSTTDDLVHELLPPSFATGLDLGHFFILDEIQKLLAPREVLRAEMHRLMIIETGGAWKMSCPDEGDSGMLLISLPFSYTGGDVVVTNTNASKAQTFSWGSQELCWASIFVRNCSSAGLEIKEVTSGYQLMLVYKLYSCMNHNQVLGVSNTLVDPHSFLLYDLLLEAKGSSSFFPNGQLLGFACQEMYERDELHNKLDEKAGLLRGVDAIMFAAAKAVGFDVELKPIYQNGSYTEFPALLYVGRSVGEKPPTFLGEFNKEFDTLDVDTCGTEELPTVREGVKTDVGVSWCLKNFSWHCGHCKTQEEVELPWYYSIALLVSVPRRSHRKSEVEDEDMLAAKRMRIYENAITYWFKRAEDKASREIDYDYKADDNDEEGDEDDEEEDEDEDEDEDDERNVLPNGNLTEEAEDDGEEKRIY